MVSAGTETRFKGSKASFKPVFSIQALDTLEHLSLRDYVYEEASRGPDLISSTGQGNLFLFFKELQNGACQ